MINFDSFLSGEITSAPRHPLAENLELPLPEANNASFEEIRTIQQRDRIPGIVKRIIPLDADTFWEYWWCVPDRLLLPEDVELIKSDRVRIENILEQLIWLFGGHCFNEDTYRQGEQLIVNHWQEVIKFASQQGFDSYLLDIDYLPTAIKCYNQQFHLKEDDLNTTYVAVEPAHWHIEFFQLITTTGGFEIQHPKPVCSCQIWTGKPFIKHLNTGETLTRYDLWVSTPLDLTQTPWYK